MGSNLHTPWTSTTTFTAAVMNPALASLDKAISYDRNVIISCDGDLSYDKSTGVFSWSGTLRIHYNREDGKAIQNTISTGSVTLEDNQFAYVDLSETNDASRTAAVASITTASASNFLAVGRVVLGYRNTTSDEFYAVRVLRPLHKIQAHIADANVAYTTGNLDTEAEIIAAFNATNGKINDIIAVLEAWKLKASS